MFGDNCIGDRSRVGVVCGVLVVSPGEIEIMLDDEEARVLRGGVAVVVGDWGGESVGDGGGGGVGGGGGGGGGCEGVSVSIVSWYFLLLGGGVVFGVVGVSNEVPMCRLFLFFVESLQ